MQLEHYELSIRGDEFTVCLQQLDALDDSSKGSVELRVVDGKLLIERQINKKNYAAIELKASGHWPFPLTLKWSNFYRLLMKEHASIVKLQLTLDPSSGNAKFIADGMHLSPEEISTQLSFELSAQMPARLQSDQTINPILQRIKEIDATNEKNGVISKEVTSKVYERDEELNRLLKVHRGAACQICGYYFLTAKDERYVECHHLEYLANDGFDCSKNMLIVCANHHRQLHYGKTKILNHTSEQVIIEIDDVVHVCQL